MGRIKDKQLPHVWKHGPDEVKHKSYKKYYIARNQAICKNQEWELSFEDWENIWGDNILQSGRKIGTYYISRKDSNESWNKYNIELRQNGVRNGYSKSIIDKSIVI